MSEFGFNQSLVAGYVVHGPTGDATEVDATVRVPQNEQVVWHAQVTVPLSSFLRVSVPLVIRIVPDGLGKVTDAVQNPASSAGGNGQRDHHRDDSTEGRP